MDQRPVQTSLPSRRRTGIDRSRRSEKPCAQKPCAQKPCARKPCARKPTHISGADSSGAAVTRSEVPPHNEEAERALLGALLLDPQRVPEISEIVHLGDFFHPKHEAVWEAILR